MDVTEKLVRALGKPDTVLFIGSGVSCSAGLPDWRSLLVSLSEYCAEIGKEVAEANELIKQNKFDDAADYLDFQLQPG